MINFIIILMSSILIIKIKISVSPTFTIFIFIRHLDGPPGQSLLLWLTFKCFLPYLSACILSLTWHLLLGLRCFDGFAFVSMYRKGQPKIDLKIRMDLFHLMPASWGSGGLDRFHKSSGSLQRKFWSFGGTKGFSFSARGATRLWDRVPIIPLSRASASFLYVQRRIAPLSASFRKR